jgi:hypothetical protein
MHQPDRHESADPAHKNQSRRRRDAMWMLQADVKTISLGVVSAGLRTIGNKEIIDGARPTVTVRPVAEPYDADKIDTGPRKVEQES